MPETLFEKVWNRHVVDGDRRGDAALHRPAPGPRGDQPAGVRRAPAGRAGKVRRPDLTFATVDHNVPTENQLDIREPMSRRQVETLRANCREFGVTLYDISSGHQGIVHVIGPELGLTLPGTTIVCGDSHTSTHGAFGALAFGIGTSEVEHVLATQTLWQGRAAAARWASRSPAGSPPGLEPKDIILADHPRDRHRRRDRARHRVLRPGDRGPLDGRADDGLQHVDRGRRPRRADRARRHDDRVHHHAATARSPPRARRSTRPSPTGRRSGPTTRRPSTATSRSTPATLVPAGDLGHQPGDDRGRDRPRPRARAGPLRQPRRRPPGPRLHGADPGHADHARSRSTSSSSARAPTAGSRTSAPAAAGLPGPEGRRGRPGPDRARAASRSGTRPRPRGSTGSSPRPAPSGGSRGAACAWR